MFVSEATKLLLDGAGAPINYSISIFQNMPLACYTFLLLFLPFTMERTSLVFPHKNMQPLSPVTSPRILTRIQPTLGQGIQEEEDQNLPTSGILYLGTASPSLFNIYHPSSIQTQHPSQTLVNLLPPIPIQTQPSSHSPANLLPPISIQTNLSLPVGSTARLHCRVSNVEQV